MPKFEYYPREGGKQLAFDIARPILQLADDLRTMFAGQSIKVKELIDQHIRTSPFIGKNYRRVLREMEDAGEVICDPPEDKRLTNTMGDRVVVTIPKR